MLSTIVLSLLIGVALWISFFAVYQLVLAILYFVKSDRSAASRHPVKRFAVIIPAHNEEAIIGTVLLSWQRVRYPRKLFDVFVIADNCTDDTARLTRAHGFRCLERRDEHKRGKGHALAWAFEQVSLSDFDAVAIVDADTTACDDFLQAMNDRLIGGARVVQGFDGVLNPDDNMMTRLMNVTNVMKNLLFNHSKSKLGLSVQLMGTGMCFDKHVFEMVPWRAFSIGEDGEQFAHLALAGIRVEFEPRAKVFAQEASSLGQAYTQRMRWSSGRLQLARLGCDLLRKGILSRDVHLVDAALTFLIPNYAMLANATLVLIGASTVVQVPVRELLLAWSAALLGAQVAYFLLGLFLSRPGVHTILSLVYAPLFLLWKMFIDVSAFFHLKYSEWVRTPRLPRKEGRMEP